MAINYAVGIPHDKNGQELQEFPSPIVAKARYITETAAATSSVISVTQDTTVVEVTAVGSTGYIRWVGTSDTQASVTAAQAGANFDHTIPANTLRRFVIPIEAQGNPASVQGVNRLNGLYRRLAIKTNLAASSIIVAEF